MEKKFNENGVQIYDYYIYRVTYLVDGRTYVGKRYISLWYTPAKGMDKYTPGEYYGSGDHIENAIRAYGVENFSREIIDEYHDITDAEIKAIEKAYIIAEWAAGHGEFNHASESYGGDIFDGMPDDIREVVIYNMTMAQKARGARDNHPFKLLTHDQRVERSKKGSETLGPDGRSERARKAITTMGKEGLIARARSIVNSIGAEGYKKIAEKILTTLGPEGRSERSHKSAMTQLSKGNHPFLQITFDQRSKISSKTAKLRYENGTNPLQNLTPDQIKLRTSRMLANRSIEWIFYNPTTKVYKIHVANWSSRFNHGFSEKLCKYSDWDQYKRDHNLDVEPIR